MKVQTIIQNVQVGEDVEQLRQHQKSVELQCFNISSTNNFLNEFNNSIESEDEIFAEAIEEQHSQEVDKSETRCTSSLIQRVMNRRKQRMKMMRRTSNGNNDPADESLGEHSDNRIGPILERNVDDSDLQVDEQLLISDCRNCDNLDIEVQLEKPTLKDVQMSYDDRRYPNYDANNLLGHLHCDKDDDKRINNEEDHEIRNDVISYQLDYTIGSSESSGKSREISDDFSTEEQTQSEEGRQTAPEIRLCRQCQFECPKPSRSFCSEGCLHLYKIRSTASYVRSSLLIRDKGICQLCFLDCEKLRLALNAELRKIQGSRQAKQQLAISIAQELGPPCPLHLKVNRRGVLTRGNFFHADHIIAVVEGGGNCGLENFRTLCIGCHHEVTATLRRNRAKCKKKEENVEHDSDSEIVDWNNNELIGKNKTTGCMEGIILKDLSLNDQLKI